MNAYQNLGLVAIATVMITAPLLAQTQIRPVKFAPGSSGATVKGNVLRGERVIYGLGAKAGQTMKLQISALEDNAVFQVYAPGAKVRADGVVGQSLPGAGETDDAKQWQGKLPRSGQYLVVVGGTRGNTTYQLQIAIH